MRRSAAAVLGVLVALALLVGCGVPTRSGADRADPEDVPFGLLDEQTTPTELPRPGVAVDVYLYDAASSRLVRVTRETNDASVEGVLQLLQEGSGETGVPVGNPLEDVDVVLSARSERGRVTVDLSEEFVTLGGSAQLIALAELVYTATGRPGVGQVSFTLEGEPTQVPTGDGSLSSDPLTRSDYQDLAPVA